MQLDRMEVLRHAQQLSTCDICYLEGHHCSRIVKVLKATKKIMALQRTISFLRSQARWSVIYLNPLECSATFPVCRCDWDRHQNLGKHIWILHLCQDRFGWVMLTYFLLFPLIFMWDDCCLESHSITNFVLIKKGSSQKTDHDRNGSDTFHYQLHDGEERNTTVKEH